MKSKKEISDFYISLQEDHHVEKSTVNEKNRIIIHESRHPISALSTIESFVDEINQSNSVAFDDSSTIIKTAPARGNRLEGYYWKINECLDAYSERFVYSPKVEAFYQACEKIGIDPRFMSFGKSTEVCLPDGKTTNAQVFNELIKVIRSICHSNSYQRKLQGHQRNALRRKAKVLTWESELFRWRSRHLVISLTLSYKEQFRSVTTLELIQEHLKNLLNNRRNNKLLKGINGYVWKIEDGISVGLHVHLLIAYSTQTNQDILVAEKIGQYWEAFITDGQGQYWNSNKNPKRYETLGHGIGVGQINHNDAERRDALRKNLEYLMKADQHLKQKGCARTHTIAMSRIPERSNAGRTRKDINPCQEAR
ncbi:MAG: hypothetical protein K5880_02255 [Hydrogenophaga sp.]|uniref:hypothetical protein n=1 Tax=Hydrogenophaga sp. TaxID=1904254 RepID=UPI00262830E0|nr:hypothetical protein [Hydrogenophaga sp.]MCV0437426.1 hypothetical protein [Hydrogenophaga sp.]